MNMKTQTIKQISWAATLVLLMGLAIQTAHADETHDIQSQGQAAMAAIQADLKANLPGVRSVPNTQATAPDEASAAVNESIRRQGNLAMRSIAWESEAQLHIHSRVAAEARPSRGGFVQVVAPMHFGALGLESN